MFRFVEDDLKDKNVTIEYIRELENRLNISFPDILVEWYTHHNKAKIAECAFSIYHLDFSVEFIIPLCYGTVTVEKILAHNRGDEYFPKTFIPLAEEVDGEDFFWDSVSGKVYYLSMGNVENPIPVCDSVERFFSILTQSCLNTSTIEENPK